ncbi:MAG: hypothetical protein U9R75_09410 [Candidatus Thermoplasmatota archaeon]|nr:hypothetical protein [Candidatus Thermoplasmatota archaeon]
MKTKLSTGNIHSFKDLLQIKQELDSSLLNEYSVEGKVQVFPSRDYEVRSKKDLERAISSISTFSSPYASLTGNIILKKQIEQ